MPIFVPSVLSFSDYYPFGMRVPNRHKSSNNNSYRYGYQGSEKDDEIKSEANSYTTWFRQLDVRLGRWLSIDPKATAFETSYSSMSNNPIMYTDKLGDTIKFAQGSDPKFIKRVNSYINKLKTTKEGLKQMRALEESKNIYTIIEIDNVLKSSFEFHYKDGSETEFTNEGIIRLGKGVAHADGVSFNEFYAFAHESNHAYQHSLGDEGFKALQEIKSMNGLVPLVELQAVGFENYVRASFNEKGFNKMRTYYTWKGQTKKLKEYTKNHWGNWFLNGSDDWDATDFLKVTNWLNIRNRVISQMIQQIRKDSGADAISYETPQNQKPAK